MNRYLAFIYIAFVIMLVSGCGGEDNLNVIDADMLIDQGWIEYSAGSYQNAIYRHQSALEMDSEKSEAYNGIAWAETKLGKIDASIDNFKKAVLKSPNNADAHAGLAGSYFTAGNYEQAIASGKSVLSINPNYESPHDPIKANNIRLLLAESYYNIGDYNSAKAQIEIIGIYGKTIDASSPDFTLNLLLAIDDLAKKI
jgi:tetratricopeptide (TPR) repeat protein